MVKGIQFGDVFTGVVLEVKEESAIVKFKGRSKPIEARILADLKAGDEIKIMVKGWFNGELVLKVIEDSDQNIDFKA